jgi:hypothetical protein
MTGSERVARQFGGCPLAGRNEPLFTSFVADYTEIVKLAVEEAIARRDRQVLPRLVVLARRAGDQDAVPQDLIAVHLSALAALVRNKPGAMARACVRHSRLLLVKLLGELALYYRGRAAVRHQALTASTEK